jgi:hypothetical protein
MCKNILKERDTKKKGNKENRIEKGKEPWERTG